MDLAMLVEMQAGNAQVTNIEICCSRQIFT
jgi:hypothetical protein